jgi:hypothetical protein
MTTRVLLGYWTGLERERGGAAASCPHGQGADLGLEAADRHSDGVDAWRVRHHVRGSALVRPNRGELFPPGSHGEQVHGHAGEGRAHVVTHPHREAIGSAALWGAGLAVRPRKGDLAGPWFVRFGPGVRPRAGGRAQPRTAERDSTAMISPAQARIGVRCPTSSLPWAGPRGSLAGGAPLPPSASHRRGDGGLPVSGHPAGHSQ